MPNERKFLIARVRGSALRIASALPPAFADAVSRLTVAMVTAFR